jgi:hypothetical protein
MDVSDRLYNTQTQNSFGSSKAGVYEKAIQQMREECADPNSQSNFFNPSNTKGREDQFFSKKNMGPLPVKSPEKCAHVFNVVRKPDPIIVGKYLRGEKTVESPLRIVSHSTTGNLDQKKNPVQTHRGKPFKPFSPR